jgi:catechol 2,3-dioxygenase-like lactoylglutathione lyase family enzyme
MEINGVAHIFITAADFERSRAFYRQLLPFLGLKEVMDAAGTYYCVGGRTGFGVRAPPAGSSAERFDQARVGLHHVCFRVRERDEVDETHAFLVSIGAKIVHRPQDDDWAPGYYSVLFEDPDGVRLEVNHVPGQGLLTPGGSGHLGGAWPRSSSG